MYTFSHLCIDELSAYLHVRTVWYNSRRIVSLHTELYISIWRLTTYAARARWTRCSFRKVQWWNISRFLTKEGGSIRGDIVLPNVINENLFRFIDVRILFLLVFWVLATMNQETEVVTANPALKNILELIYTSPSWLTPELLRPVMNLLPRNGVMAKHRLAWSSGEALWRTGPCPYIKKGCT